MRDVLTKMGRHGAAFAVGLMLTRLVGFILSPILSRALSPQDYGLADNLAQLSNLAMMIAAQAVPSGLFRAYAYSARDDQEKSLAISTAFRYTLVSSAIVAILVGALAPYASHLVTGKRDYWPLVVFVLLTYFFANLKNICFQILRADYRSREFLIVSCSEFLLCAGLNIYFVVVERMGAAGMIYSNLIGAGVALLLAVRFVPQSIGNGFDVVRAKEMVHFGLPLVPQAIFIFLLNTSSLFIFVFLLGEENGLSASGLYGRGASFASILDGVLLMPFTMLWPSVYYEVAKRKSATTDLGRCATYYLVVAVLLALGLSAVSEPLVALMLDRNFRSAHAVIPLLAFAFAIYGLSEVTKVGLMVSGSTKKMPPLVAIAAVICAALNFFLIPRIDIRGAGYAQLGAYSALAILIGIASYKYLKVRYEWLRVVRIGFAIVVIFTMMHYWPMPEDPTKLELIGQILRRGSAVVVAYPLILLVTGFLTARERELIGDAWGRLLHGRRKTQG